MRRPGSSSDSRSRITSPWWVRSTWRCCRRRVSNSGEPSSGSRRTCNDHPNVESHTVRLVGDTDHWTKLETGAKSAEQQRVRGVETVGGRKRAENRGSEIRDAASRATAGNPAKFEETWKSWEHQVDVYENRSSSKLDDDVKISVVLREAPQKLRDHLLVNSQQFESNYNKLRAIIQAYLNTNKNWTANDFRETDPTEVDYIGKSKGKGKIKSKSKGNRKGNSIGGSKDNGKGKSKGKSKDRNQGKSNSKSNSKGKGNGKPDNDKRVPRLRKEGPFRTRLLVTSQPRQDGERGRSRERQCRAWKRIRVYC